jgi:hypothetical protein
MRFALTLLLLGGACGGPTQQQLAETPAATERRPQAEAPPASTSDKDRERAIQQFDDMQTTQQAYEQAGQESNAPPQQPLQGQPAPPKKKGVAEQGTLPKKTGPAEQAPK